MKQFLKIFSISFLCFSCILWGAVFIILKTDDNETDNSINSSSVIDGNMEESQTQAKDSKKALEDKKLDEDIESLNMLVSEYKNSPPAAKAGLRNIIMKQTFFDNIVTSLIASSILALLGLIFKRIVSD